MANSVIQRSFAGGSIAPEVQGRTDQVKVQTGFDDSDNYQVTRYGGLQNRMGTEFITEVRDSTGGAPRLLKFVFNDEQTYVLEFGDLYVRFIKDGVQLREAAVTVTAISNTTPPVVTTVPGHGYATGDQVFVFGSGLAAFDGNRFTITVLSPTTFELDGAVASGISATGTVEKVFELVTPFAIADVGTLDTAQSADVLTIVHPTYAPRDLVRLGPTDLDWSLSLTSFLPEIGRPTTLAVASGGAGASTFKYKVTAVDADTNEESLAAVEALLTINDVTQALPAVVTVVGDQTSNLSNGDEVLIDGIVGMTELNTRVFVIANVTFVGPDTTFELVLEDSTGFAAYVSDGTVGRIHAEVTLAADPTPAAPHVVSWVAPTTGDPGVFRIYRDVSGIFGFVGQAKGTTFDDTGINADVSATEPTDRQPFRTTDNFPSSVTYFQQRRSFARTNNEPDRFLLSRTGRFTNFTFSSPLQLDDSIKARIAGNEVNQIRHIREVGGRIIVFTSNGNWTLDGDEAGIVTPFAINPRQWSYHGSSVLPPIPINNTAIYQQARGQFIHDVTFDLTSSRIGSRDLTVFATHLFQRTGFSIVHWDYQETPNSIVWAATTRGGIHALTYEPQHEIWGWHKHASAGSNTLDIVSVPEGNEDFVYILFNRSSIGGSNRLYIERMASRNLLSRIADSKFLDSHLTYNGLNLTLAGVDNAATMLLTGGPPWGIGDGPFTLTASDATFAAADVGNEVHLGKRGSDFVRLVITAFISPTVVTVNVTKTVPAAFQGVATTSWGLCVDEVDGLEHLESKTVAIFADGFSLDQQVVPSTGVVPLSGDIGYCVVHVGVPIIADVNLLPIERLDGETLMDKKMLENRVNVDVFETQSFKVGTDANHLKEAQLRNDEDMDEPVDLETGLVSVLLETTWRKEGGLLIRQDLPFPITITGVLRSGTLGGAQ